MDCSHACCALAQMVASGSGGPHFGAWGPLRVIIIVLQLLTGCAFVITLGGLSALLSLQQSSPPDFRYYNLCIGQGAIDYAPHSLRRTS